MYFIHIHIIYKNYSMRNAHMHAIYYKFFI